VTNEELVKAVSERMIAAGDIHTPWAEQSEKTRAANLRMVAAVRELLDGGVTSDERKVLADIRAATPKGWKAVAFAPSRGRDVLQEEGRVHRAEYKHVMQIILAPLAPKPQNCPACGTEGCVEHAPDDEFYVFCGAECGVRGPLAGTSADAIALWNRLTLAPAKE
jgi:hypothetical protein